MKYPGQPTSEPSYRRISTALQRLVRSDDVGPYLHEILDVVITMAGADMGTLQRFDDRNDWLEIVASRGFSDEALAFFHIVRRDTNTTCAVALTRRMRVFVEDISHSYLFVGTPELAVLQDLGIAAIQSTPLISSTGRFWGVVSTHFREPQAESGFDHLSLSRLAIQVADSLEQREELASSPSFSRARDRDGSPPME
jgi:GAF domain-containing protein